eukprot:10187749-Karenia_brevis.AAC.1
MTMSGYNQMKLCQHHLVCPIPEERVPDAVGDIPMSLTGEYTQPLQDGSGSSSSASGMPPTPDTVEPQLSEDERGEKRLRDDLDTPGDELDPETAAPSEKHTKHDYNEHASSFLATETSAS